MPYWGPKTTRAKWATMALLASVSVPAQSQEIDELVATSQSIRDTFKYGIQAAAGSWGWAEQGGIAPTGVVEGGFISMEQADAYNKAVADVLAATYSYDPGAQQYFEDQADQAMDQVSQAIDTYVQAAQQIILVAEVNERAQDAQEAGDERGAIALQEYMGANDVTLEEPEVELYNESLQAIETAAQIAGAYMAIANDQTLVDQANSKANDYLATFAESSGIFFDNDAGTVTVSFDSYNMDVQLDVVSFYVTTQQIFEEAETHHFYTTSPEGGCWFIVDQTEKEACLSGS